MKWYEQVMTAVVMGLPVGAVAGLPLMMLAYFANGGEPVFWPFVDFWMIGTIAAFVAIRTTGDR